MKELVKRELYHYKPVATLCNDLIDNLYALAEAIDDKQEITITYYKWTNLELTGESVRWRLYSANITFI